jgi:hypothetical protein
MGNRHASPGPHSEPSVKTPANTGEKASMKFLQVTIGQVRCRLLRPVRKSFHAKW